MDQRNRKSGADQDREAMDKLRRKNIHLNSQLKAKNADFENLRRDFMKASDGEKAKRKFISFELKREKAEVMKWKEKCSQFENPNKKLLCEKTELASKMNAVSKQEVEKWKEKCDQLENANQRLTLEKTELAHKLDAAIYNNGILLDMRSSAECTLNEYLDNVKVWREKLVCMEKERDDLKVLVDTSQKIIAKFTDQIEEDKRKHDEAFSEIEIVAAGYEQKLKDLELKYFEKIRENASLNRGIDNM